MRATARVSVRTRPPQERREQLMDAAQRLFLQRDVASTTIEQITRAAGVAKGTFYLYFTSKEDVLAALRERFSQELLRTITAAVDSRPIEDWPGKLAAWARSSVAGYLASMRVHDVVFYESRPPTHKGLDDSPIVDHLRHLLEHGVEAGAWSIPDPRFTALFLFSGLHGVIDASSSGKRNRRGQMANKLEQLCFRVAGLGETKA